jgi:hypothetical protein
LIVALAGCGPPAPVDSDAPAETLETSDTAANGPCATLGPAVETVAAVDAVIVPDGVPRILTKDPGFLRVPLDPDGHAGVTVFYDGTNAVTAVFSSQTKEEHPGCEAKNTWEACPELTMRGVTTPAPWAYELELGSDVTSVWLVALPTSDAPGPCGG